MLHRGFSEMTSGKVTTLKAYYSIFLWVHCFEDGIGFL